MHTGMWQLSQAIHYLVYMNKNYFIYLNDMKYEYSTIVLKVILHNLR